MSKVDNAQTVEQQYSDDKNLSIRISLHNKYSTNKYGYSNWIFDFYQFFNGCKILELGCGNGIVWEKRINRLPVGTNLVLSDFSIGMVELVKEKFKGNSNVSTEIIDIQEIGYSDNTFDIVIANSMLYHVPNLPKAVSEVYRVLKPNGKFYASTTGVNGMTKYLHEKLKEFNPEIDAFGDDSFSFTLQNGNDILSSKFNNINVYEYKDSLEITETVDLISWILSTNSMSEIDKSKIVGLDTFFGRCKDKNGIIKIPKQAGMFVAVK
ncbi:class I SAM-dependent methyltransferase [Alkaliphilus peptidifermentans]|uniref:Methyltransferase domain-containing protein n=1 Tax=Alkaliphilus peptidifermentans DSM 18978 TaxID=1120976 RepID=A0A1G5LDV5_9FIRM|nr:class I SAM-dependent methyltransferase [Alkaliphilus peptidifermentans]SCZ11123.1 Methyltransferase domain-containing protein [Alkaliphilus peptidifermentans DSM 18978]